MQSPSPYPAHVPQPSDSSDGERADRGPRQRPNDSQGKTQGRGLMLLISGPSGCGKSTICKRLLEDPRVIFSVSATTRPMRQGEVDGRDYFFLTPAEFQAKRHAGEFIESAEVYGNLYGTLRGPMQAAIDRGFVYLVEIDVQGALQLQAAEEPGIYVFIAPPSFEELEARLIGRGSESEETLRRRLSKARDEYEERGRYDHVVVNDDLERAVAEVRRIAGLDSESDLKADPQGDRVRESDSQRSRGQLKFGAGLEADPQSSPRSRSAHTDNPRPAE